MIHEIADMPVWGEPTDPYIAQENDELRQQLEEMELEIFSAKEQSNIYYGKMLDANKNLEWTRRQLAEKTSEENIQLTHKVCLMADIIQEYENLLAQYVGYTQVKLTTNRLNELKKRGGLSL